jgi:hypothetical protein
MPLTFKMEETHRQKIGQPLKAGKEQGIVVPSVIPALRRWRQED